MTDTQRLCLWIYAILIGIWPIRYVALIFIFRKLHRLTPSSPRFTGPHFPLVSAMIPAKDEEGMLAACLASVQAQSYPNFEILIVDDRSTDRTPEIARKIAENDPRARVITITDLPAGWTGKTHGLHVAAQEAKGDWFWFLDADTLHEPDSLSIVMEYARRENASLASLLPEMRCESFWEMVTQPLAGIVLMQSFPLFKVNDDRNKLAFANGQYILIDRPAYEAAEGHISVKDKFVEDIHLARHVKALGLPIRTAVAQGIGSTRMYSSLPGLVRGWSRILYDALDRNPWRLAWKALDPLIFSQSAHLALFVALILLATGGGAFAWWLLGLSVWQHVATILVLDKLYRESVRDRASVLWYPLAGLVIDVIVYRAIKMCLTGKVTWRGTAYQKVATVEQSV